MSFDGSLADLAQAAVAPESRKQRQASRLAIINLGNVKLGNFDGANVACVAVLTKLRYAQRGNPL